MLRYVATSLDAQGGGRRDWYQSSALDLFVWHDTAGRVTAFQFTFGQPGSELLCRWKEGARVTHYEIEPGDNPGGHSRSPLLQREISVSYQQTYQVFMSAAAELPESVVKVVASALGGP